MIYFNFIRKQKFVFLILLTGWILSSLGVDYSPSRSPGGDSNNLPNRADGAPSIFQSPFRWIFGEPRSEAMKRIQAPPNFKLNLVTEPSPFVPEKDKTLKAKMIATNEGRDKYILEFESAQHCDFVITRKDGSEVFRWSENKSFSQQKSSIVLNRNEKVTYEGEIFSVSNQITSIPPGDYKLKGSITAKTPISVETQFSIVP